MATHRNVMTTALSAAASLALLGGSALAQPASQPGSAPSGARSAGPRGADGIGGARSRVSRVEARGARVEARGARVEARAPRVEARGARVEARGARVRAQSPNVRAEGARSFGDRGLGGTRSQTARVEARGARVEARGARIRQQAPRARFDGPDTIDGGRGLGGVRSQGPRPIGSTGSLLPPVPDRDRGPFPSTVPVITDEFGRIIRQPGAVGRRPFDDDFGDTFDERVFAASAAVRDEDFWYRVHLGRPGDLVQRGRRALEPYPYDYLVPGPYVNQWPYGRRYNQWPVYTVGAGYVDPGVYYGMQYAAPQYTVPPLPEPEPVRELTAVERADFLVGLGAVDEATAAYRAHLRENPDDAVAMRSFAVALLRAGRPEEAVALAAMAYETDPVGLALRPIPTEFLFRDAEELRRELNRAVGYANNVNSASSWLLVAALMQAEGRDQVASRMVDRAAGLGLSERVTGALSAELGS